MSGVPASASDPGGPGSRRPEVEPGHRRFGYSRREILRRGALTAGAAALAPRVLNRLGDGGTSELGPIRPVANLAGLPSIITRAEWGADERLGNHERVFAPLRKAIVHHTAEDSPDPYSDPAAQMRAIQRAHVNNGWVDFGYHFAVAPDGRIFEGRWARDYAGGVPTGEDTAGRLVIGAHALDHNTGSLGVVLLGNLSNREATPAALDAAARVIAWKFRPRGIGAYGSTPYVRASDGVTEVFPDICGHRDVFATGCPGSVWIGLPQLRDRVNALIASGLVGFRVLGRDGSLVNAEATPGFALSGDIGDPRRNVRPGLEVQALAGTASGGGAWVADAAGAIYSFGDAPFYGSLGAVRLNRPIVTMATTPTGGGYWLVATDGGVFCFGDATFHGSTGAIALNEPIVGMAPTPSGQGYWLVASDGGVFCFGDAGFYGSTGGIHLQQPVCAMAAAPDGRGYWLVARDGGVFCFGSAGFHGSGVGRPGFSPPAVDILPTGAAGYWLLDGFGGIHPCGDAQGAASLLAPESRPPRAFVPVVRP